MSETWSTGVFQVCSGKDVGPFCFLQVCCCGPCVWGEALREAGIESSSLFTLAVLCGGNSILDETAGYFARRQVARKYRIEEQDSRSVFLSCCCAPCARYQELNTIMVRENLQYGCATVRPTTMKRSSVS